MNNLSFYTHEKMTDRMYLLTEGYAAKRMVMGLVEGDEKVLLVNAGLGMCPDLRDYVEEIVGKGKPILCVCTDGHTNHVGSAKLFDQAYLNERDWPLANESGLVTETRLNNMLDLTEHIPALVDYCRENCLVNNDTVFENYDGGQEFDLGGITVKALALPGHTPGSMLLWCREENWMFAGNTVAQNVSVKNVDRRGLRQYKNDLERLVNRVPEDLKIYCTDLRPPLQVKDVRALIKSCEEILAGKTLNDIPGESYFSDNKNRKEMRCHFAENCSVAYNAELIGARRSEIDDFLFYSYEKISSHVYVLAENNARDNELTLGLIVGDEKALLVDTGMGMNGQLRGYVESIIGNKPLIVTSTHGNIDHLGGSIMFGQRFLNIRDHAEVGRATGTPRRFIDMEKFCNGNEEALEYCRRHWIDNSMSTFDNIEAGETFDLGGVTVEVLYSAGHTPGHLSYFIPEEKICFVGDSLSYSVLLRRLTGEEHIKYADNMEKFHAYIGADTKLYPGHSNRAHDASIITNIVAACREVAAGKLDQDPPANILRPDKPGGLRNSHYHGNCRIIYEQGNLDKHGETVTKDF